MAGSTQGNPMDSYPGGQGIRVGVSGDREGPLLPSGAPGHPAHTASAHGPVSPSLLKHKGPITTDTHPNRRGRRTPRGCTNMQGSQEFSAKAVPAPVSAGAEPTRLGWAWETRVDKEAGRPRTRGAKTASGCVICIQSLPPLWASVSSPTNKGSQPMLFHVGNFGFSEKAAASWGADRGEGTLQTHCVLPFQRPQQGKAKGTIALIYQFPTHLSRHHFLSSCHQP